MYALQLSLTALDICTYLAYDILNLSTILPLHLWHAS